MNRKKSTSAGAGADYGKAIFWGAFAVIVASLGIAARFTGEEMIVPLLLGLAVLGIFSALKSINEGGIDE